MLEFLLEFKEQFLAFLNFIGPIAGIAFMTLGFISITGRLLEVTKTDHAKNIFAAIVIPVLSFLYQRTFIDLNFEILWNTLELTTLSVIFYIAVCWRFYSRIDALLDRKIGKDNFKPTKRKRKK